MKIYFLLYIDTAFLFKIKIYLPTLHVDLGCAGGQCAYYPVVRLRKMYAPKSKDVLNSQVHLKSAPAVYKQNEQIRKACEKLNLRVVFKSGHSLLTKGQLAGMVYCQCGNTGEIQRCLETRVKEQGCVQQGVHKEVCHHRTSVGTPALSEWEDTGVLDRATRPVQLLVKEALHIQKTPTNNRINCAYYQVVRLGKMYAPKLKDVLNSQVHLKSAPAVYKQNEQIRKACEKFNLRVVIKSGHSLLTKGQLAGMVSWQECKPPLHWATCPGTVLNIAHCHHLHTSFHFALRMTRASISSQNQWRSQTQESGRAQVW